jgi:serine/threonine protein kinase
MPSVSIQHLLSQYQGGALSIEALRAQIEAMCGTDASLLRRWVIEVQEAMTARRLSESLGRALLDMLTAADTRTRVEHERTTVIEPDRTLLRSAVDAARDATVSLSSADPDAALLAASRNATAARTLRFHQSTLARASHELPPHEPTQVIAERLVQSLDRTEGHRGPIGPGTVIKHRFELERQIGKGGMGVVFAAIDRRKVEARDPSPRVAFKVMNADFERHPQALIALQREARKAQTLAHPNVVTVFDFDRDGDVVYVTMELLNGRPLEAMVREVRGRGMEPAKALSIVRGIAEGLAYAHRKGIVHSDLKPANVFVLEDGTPKILDFGIARAVPNAAEAQDIFDAGSLGAYTEAYATDEMVEGADPHPADDMYALGLIAYELITGFHPYQRHSAPKARALGLQPPALKGLKMREARALVRCLSFDRNQRPRDASEFLKAFRGVTPLQKATIAVAVVLAITAGYLSYENYRETSPSVPFASLPLKIQQEFKAAMEEGDKEWSWYERDGNIFQLQAAAFHYAEAYALHERNRDAVKALRKVADAALTAAKGDREKLRTTAQFLLDSSEYYRRYEPVVAAAQ